MEREQMRIRRLAERGELKQFQDGFRRAIQRRSRGAPGDVSLGYLQRCRVVRGVYDPQRVMIGGYAIGTTQPLRLLEFVPDAARAEIRAPRGASWDDCCEITCLWRTRAISAAQMTLRVWPTLVFDAITAAKPYILRGSDDPRLDAYYNRMFPPTETLYRGPSVHGLDEHLSAYARKDGLRRVAYFVAIGIPRRFFGARWSR